MRTFAWTPCALREVGRSRLNAEVKEEKKKRCKRREEQKKKLGGGGGIYTFERAVWATTINPPQSLGTFTRYSQCGRYDATDRHKIINPTASLGKTTRYSQCGRYETADHHNQLSQRVLATTSTCEALGQGQPENEATGQLTRIPVRIRPIDRLYIDLRNVLDEKRACCRASPWFLGMGVGFAPPRRCVVCQRVARLRPFFFRSSQALAPKECMEAPARPLYFPVFLFFLFRRSNRHSTCRPHFTRSSGRGTGTPLRPRPRPPSVSIRSVPPLVLARTDPPSSTASPPASCDRRAGCAALSNTLPPEDAPGRHWEAPGRARRSGRRQARFDARGLSSAPTS